MKFISKKYLKYLRSLRLKKYRKLENRILIEGDKLVKEVLRSDVELEFVICSEEFWKKNSALIEVLKLEKIEILLIHNRNICNISDLVKSQGIFGVVKIKVREFNLSLFKKKSDLIALDNISDPGNLGTIIRTAHWFGISGIIIGKNSIEVFNPKVIRASMGSVFHIPIWYELELTDKLLELKKAGYKLIGADPGGNEHINKICKKFLKVIIFGNESNGISSGILELCDYKIRIKGEKSFDSINLAVAAGIFMWELKK